MNTKKAQFEWGAKTYVMGILNITPDSFSGDGALASPRGALGEAGTDSKGSPWIDEIVEKGGQMERDGADVLDVGGESTRPGATPVSLEEELARVIPVIKALSQKVQIPISIDTYKAEVARQAIEAGATIINDAWGGKREPEILKVAAEKNVPIILMHNRSDAKNLVQNETLGNSYAGVEYKNLIEDIKKELQDLIDEAIAAGVRKENIIMDPGLGFGKTVEQNIELIQRLDEIKSLGLPLLVGPSRKSFVGHTLNLPPEDRLEGTIAAVTLCIQKGADIIRVHDVKENNRAVRFTDAVVRIGR